MLKKTEWFESEEFWKNYGPIMFDSTHWAEAPGIADSICKIAGLSKGVLIVRAGKKSGTLYTAEYAEEYGRDLFAIPYSVGIASGVGTNDLIKRGAILTDTPEDILLFYGIEEKKSETEELTDIEKAVVTAIAEEPLHIEKICEKTGKKVFEIASVLSFLEIKGIIVKAGINVYGLGKNLSEE